MAATIDITEEIKFGFNDEEALPILRCVCGKRFELWDFIISVYEDDPASCPHCGRRFYFLNQIRIYEVVD